MQDERDDKTEWIDGHMGNPPTLVYKGTKIPVPEQRETNGFRHYDNGCPLCGSYTCIKCF